MKTNNNKNMKEIKLHTLSCLSIHITLYQFLTFCFFFKWHLLVYNILVSLLHILYSFQFQRHRGGCPINNWFPMVLFRWNSFSFTILAIISINFYCFLVSSLKRITHTHTHST